MNAAQRRHYNAIQQLAQDEWQAEPAAEDGLTPLADSGDEVKPAAKAAR